MTSGQQEKKILNNLICWSFCALLFFIPLVFCNQLFLAFELPKAIFFKFILALISLLIGVKIFLEKGAALPRLPKVFRFLFGGYIFSLIIATIFSASPVFSFFGSHDRQQGLFQILLYLTFFIATIFYFSGNKRDINKVIKAALYGTLTVSIFAILQRFFPTFLALWNTDSLLGRQAATLGHPNFLATYLVILFPFFYVLKEKYWKFLGLIILAALFFTGSRAGALAVFAEIILLSFVLLKGSRTRRILVYVFAGFFLILAISSRLFLSENFDRSIDARSLVWKASVQQIIDRPFFGYGPEMMKNSFMKYSPVEILKLENFYDVTDRAHNEIIDTSVNIGIMGLIFYFAFILWLIRVGWQSDQRAASIAIIGLLIANIFGFSTTVHYIFFWFLAGIIVVSSNHLETKKTRGFILIPLIIFSIIGAAYGVMQFAADYANRKAAISTAGPKSFESIAYFHRAAEINPFEAEYYSKGGEYSLMKAEEAEGPVREEYMKEARWFEASAEEKFGTELNDLIYLKAILLRDEQDYTTSLAIFEKLGEKAPNNPKYILEWARTFKAMGDYKSALEKYDFYISLAPTPDRLFLKHNPDFEDVLKEIKEME